MQQYRKSNFSDVFCLNCIFVIDAAAVKQLVSRSFLMYGVSAVASDGYDKPLCTKAITIIDNFKNVLGDTDNR